MSRTLYYSIQFVSLHQKRPSDLPSPTSIRPYLIIGGVETTYSKYGLEFGFGDPGENPNRDGYDYPEFRIESATFTRPQDYYSGEISYLSEYSDPSHFLPHHLNKWHSITVSDDFLIPSDISGTDSGSSFADSWGSSNSSNGSLTSPIITIDSASLDLISEGTTQTWVTFKKTVSDQLQEQLSNIAKNIAHSSGLGNVFDILTKAGNVHNSLIEFTNNATNAFELMMNNFDGMTLADSQQLTDTLLNDSFHNFLELATGELGFNTSAISILRNLYISATVNRNADGTSRVSFTVGNEWKDNVDVSNSLFFLISSFNPEKFTPNARNNYIINFDSSDTVKVISENTIVYSGGGDDVIMIYDHPPSSGYSQHAIVHAGFGDDTLNASFATFSPSLYGGTGNDLYLIQPGLSNIIELPGEGVDEVFLLGQGQTYTIPINIENVRTFSTNIQSVNGNNLDNVFLLRCLSFQVCHLTATLELIL